MHPSSLEWETGRNYRECRAQLSKSDSEEGKIAILKERHIASQLKKKTLGNFILWARKKKDENWLQFKTGNEFRSLEVGNCLLWFDPSANEYDSAEGTGALKIQLSFKSINCLF